MTAQVRLLARHFLWRFLDNDLISPDSDVHDTGTLILAFLAVPSLLGTGLFLFIYANPFMAPYQRLLMLLPGKFMYVAWSMLVMSLLTLVDWDALSLDGRDYAILGSLPIASHTLLAGKVAALALFVSAVAVAVNLVPSFFFPLVYLSSGAVTLPLPLVGVLMAGHAAACVGAALFAFLAILVVRALLLLVLGANLFRRVSLPVQFAGGLALVIGFFSSLSMSSLTARSAAVYLSPPMWFLGLYEVITAPTLARASREPRLWTPADTPAARATYAAYEPIFRQLAPIALVALAAVALAAGALYLASFIVHASQLRQQATTQPARAGRVRALVGHAIRRWVVRDPVQRAVFFFTLQTLGRSARHKLYLAGYVGAGVLLIYSSLAPLVMGREPWGGSTPSLPLLSVQFVLSFFLLVGVRVVFTIPAELRANWLFRLTTGSDVRRHVEGVRRAGQLAVVVPFFGCLFPLHLALWGWRIALTHTVFGILWAFVLLDVLLLSLEKLPFTCSHVAGKGNLRVLWPLYIAGYGVYAYWFAGRERDVLFSPAASAALAAVLCLVLGGLAVYRRHLLRRRAGFVFADISDATNITLDLP